MVACIQIGPNALFATVVLSPAWGSQYRQADSPESLRRSARVGLPQDGGGEHPRTAGGEQGGEQMALL